LQHIDHAAKDFAGALTRIARSRRRRHIEHARMVGWLA
jgi:hypothetical protein